MTKTLYLTWHGPTLFDAQGRLEGWSDSPLTEEAQRAARRTGSAFFAPLPTRPDAFLSSMSERACDTLELVCAAAYGEVPAYERLKGLKDLNRGSYEGQGAYLAPSPEESGSFFVKFGGESTEGLVARIEDTLRAVVARPHLTSALVSTHRLAAALFCGPLDAEAQAWCLGAPGCPVVTIAYDEATGTFALAGRFAQHDKEA